MQNNRKESPRGGQHGKKAVERTSRALHGKVFPGFGKVPGKAAEAVFSAVVRTGSALVTDIAAAMGGNGIPVHDRGFDGEGFVGHALRSGHRAVVRAKEMSRDVFGTGRGIDEGMARAPCVRATLRSPTRRAEAEVRWRAGFFPAGDAHLPVLVVSSAFGERTPCLYAPGFGP